MFTILRLFKKKQARKSNDILAFIFKLLLALGALAGLAYAGYKIYEKIQEKRMSSFCCCDDEDCCDCECDCNCECECEAEEAVEEVIEAADETEVVAAEADFEG